MKKLVTFLAALVFVLAFSAVAYGSVLAGPATVDNANWLHVRSTAATLEDNVIAVIPRGTEVWINRAVEVPNNRRWYHVTYDGGSGYVWFAFLIGGHGHNLPAPPAPVAGTGAGSGAIAVGAFEPVTATVVGAPSVNVRSAHVTTRDAVTNAPTLENAVGSLMEGAQVQLIARSPGAEGRQWYRVQFTRADGTILEGWVFSRYLSY